MYNIFSQFITLIIAQQTLGNISPVITVSSVLTTIAIATFVFTLNRSRKTDMDNKLDKTRFTEWTVAHDKKHDDIVIELKERITHRELTPHLNSIIETKAQIKEQNNKIDKQNEILTDIKVSLAVIAEQKKT